jgi:hypothetical protein
MNCVAGAGRQRGDTVCIRESFDGGDGYEDRRCGQDMQKRACDERAIIGSRRLRRFFILTAK